MTTKTDQQLLTEFTEALMNAFTDTSGTDDDRWRAVASEALERLARGDGFELAKRRRKWGQPVPLPQPGTLPPAVPIASPDEMGIALSGAS